MDKRIWQVAYNFKCQIIHFLLAKYKEINIYNDDETMNQSENNMRAYATMFNQIDEGVTNNG